MNNRKLCAFCRKNHYSDQCDVVTDLSARMECLKKDLKCYKCLKAGHIVKNCRVFVKCYTCKRQGDHHTSLCRESSQKNKIDNSTHLAGDKNSVLLQTATCTVYNECNKRSTSIKALFDSCSQKTYISDTVVKNLNLTPLRRVNMVVKTFGNKHGKEMKVFEYEFTIKPRFGEAIKINAIAVPTICAPIGGQVIKEAIKSHPFLQKIYLADDGTHPDTPIGLLLGADMYWKMVSCEIKRDDSSGLMAINSVFGWLLNGPVARGNQFSVNLISSDVTVMKIQSYVTEEKNLSNELHKFWDLDTIGIKENESSVYDTFMESITFDKGRYQLELPFKENHALLSDNYNLSLKRLKKLKSRLSNDVELLKDYDNVFREQLKLGIIEEVEGPGEVRHVTYLPRREVIREDKTSTKLRVVFDASAKSRENVSLNDVLCKRPCLTPLLYDVLLRFRIHPVAIIADIEKAYLQIGIKENHRDFLRCL